MKRLRFLQDASTIIILTIMSLFIVMPLLWIVGNSLKSDQDIRVNMAKMLPTEGYQFQNYAAAWEQGNIGQTFFNSAVITFFSVFSILVVALLTAYAIARINFKGKNIMMTVFISTMMIPLGQVIMIPQYRLMTLLNLVDTRQGLILLYINGGIAFSVFLLTSFLKKIPFEIDEAATIDGCNRLQVLVKILLPLSRPGLATVIIFQFMNVWNDYFLPLIYIQDPQLKTITLGLTAFTQMWGLVDYNRLFAALVIITMPVLVIYVIFQKQFISGITAGSVKA